MAQASRPVGGQQQRLVFGGELAAFARLLNQPGKTGPQRLAAFEALPEAAQDLAWRSLRRQLERERDGAER